MPPRATPQLVRDAVRPEEAAILTDGRLLIPLRLASTLIDRAYGSDEGEVPRMLEVLVAAHYVTQRDRSLASRKYAEGGESYHKREVGDEDFESTVYGQQALALDATNCLRNGSLQPHIFEAF